MKMNNVFVTKPTVETMLQTKRSVTEKIDRGTKKLLTDTQENITRANTELLGVYPFLMPFMAYLFENMPNSKIHAGNKENTHYQIGTAESPVPFSLLYESTMLDHKKLATVTDRFNLELKKHNKKPITDEDLKGFISSEKEQFKIELYRMIKEKRSYWLQDKESGNYLLDEPLRIVLVANNSEITLNRFNALVSKQEGGEYKAGEKIPKLGFIIHAYKPLFEGHLNNYKKNQHQPGGYIKQPKHLYAMARFYSRFMPNADFRDFTPVHVVKLFYYLSMRDNQKGQNINIDMLEMLKCVSPGALFNNTIRHTQLKPIGSSLAVIEGITNDFPEDFDMCITGNDFDMFDWEYADRINPKNSIERLILAMKHHLKANKNTLTLTYMPTKYLKIDGKKGSPGQKLQSF
jgi:hypothetical protein